MKIAIDAFGGDHSPEEIVKGAITSVNLIDDVEIALVGKEEKIKEILAEYGYNGNKIEIVNATEVISNDESPTVAIRQKKDSSIVVAFDALKNRDDIVGLISAGSTGAVLTAATLRLGRIKGVLRPALAPELPNLMGSKTLLIDSGANVDAKPEYLVQFAIMGSEYMKAMHSIKNPRVALVSVGTEDHKGNEFTHEVFARLKELKNINFVGNMEARDALSGKYDVIVCDGFTGNVLLKSAECGVDSLNKIMKEEILKLGFKGKLGYLLLKKAFRKTKERINYTSVGAAFLGVQKLVLKSHGSSKAETIYSCVLQLRGLYKAKMIENLTANLKQIEGGANE
ncbi:MAG: phosphate acyltransferase PlsX [Clostridia bacterium]|nr:phosphate acyltransferase PlsX [Clostridia bacterium]